MRKVVACAKVKLRCGKFQKIYFFDDNSPDGSGDKAKKFDWIVVKNEKNLGHGGNYKKALKTAFDDGADYAVEIHADNQYSPNEVIKAKQQLENDYDLIIGSRLQNNNPFVKDGMPFLRYLTNKIFSFFTSKLCNIKLTEFHTGCKIVSRNFCKKTPYQENSDSYLFSFQIILQAAFFKLKYMENNGCQGNDQHDEHDHANTQCCDVNRTAIYFHLFVD